MVVAIVFAFGMLLFSTMNITVSIFSTLSIIGIVAGVVAVMQFAGWELGIAESVTVVILIGFSVDYVVHLGNHYVGSVYPDRKRRMDESLTHLGVSIFSGAITTMGSGLFLFFTVMIFFQKFAIIITSTILYSLLYSLVFFAALNYLVGPEERSGDIMHYVFLPLYSKCFKKKGDEQPKKDGAAEEVQDP